MSYLFLRFILFEISITNLY